MSKRTIQLFSSPEDRALRAGRFLLLPENPVAPLITSQPGQNFDQYTWVRKFENGTPVYQTIKISNNTINALQGTEFSFLLRAIDLSNVNDTNDTQFLTYRWKKDDAYIYELNTLNDNTGVAGLYVTAEESKPELSGRYVCEVSNPYGTTETIPITVNIIDPLKHPKMYKNLILNGDGDGGLTGWTGDTDIITHPFLDNWSTRNFGSFVLGSIGFPRWNFNEGYVPETEDLRSDFYFSKAGHGTLFYVQTANLFQSDPNFSNINFLGTASLTVQGQHTLITRPPQILLNEDYVANSPFAAFFPGPNWIDQYNQNLKNKGVVGLQSELTHYTPTYFTRDKIKFQKYGGSPIATLSQTIDVSDVADLVDGNAYGIKQLTSQFFAYVGAGITDYKIRVTTSDGSETLNYMIGDTEDVWHQTVGNFSGRETTPGAKVSKLGRFLNKKLALEPGSDIEIIPILNDTTRITIEYINEFGRVLKLETLNGPDVRDVWAIKEKAYFPVTLYGVFNFLKTNGNHNITVLGQTYSNTDALRPFFDLANSGNGGFGLFNPNAPYDIFKNSIGDKKARFLYNRFKRSPFIGEGSYPPSSWYANPQTDSKIAHQALYDRGGAAMFAVQRDIIVPPKTRSVRISVTFTHNSEMFLDSSPETKGWDQQELYSNEYGQSTGYSARLTEYGFPRCGVTKMKFLLAPNNLKISEDYPTYTLPPENNTTLGRHKQKYNIPDYYNSAAATTFVYEFITPDPAPVPPNPADPFYSDPTSKEYQQALQASLTSASDDPQIQNTAPIPPSEDFGQAEDLDQNFPDMDTMDFTTPSSE